MHAYMTPTFTLDAQLKTAKMAHVHSRGGLGMRGQMSARQAETSRGMSFAVVQG